MRAAVPGSSTPRSPQIGRCKRSAKARGSDRIGFAFLSMIPQAVMMQPVGRVSIVLVSDKRDLSDKGPFQKDLSLEILETSRDA